MARRVAHEEGILLGSSGGLAVAAALKVGQELTADDLVVVLIPDSGRGYLSRVYNDEWMATLRLRPRVRRVRRRRARRPQRGAARPALRQPRADRARGARSMRANGVSQLPVCKNEPPFAAAEVSGAVDELALMDAAFRDPSTLDMPVEKVMGPKLPTVGVGQPLSRAVELLDRAPGAPRPGRRPSARGADAAPTCSPTSTPPARVTGRPGRARGLGLRDPSHPRRPSRPTPRPARWSRRSRSRPRSRSARWASTRASSTPAPATRHVPRSRRASPRSKRAAHGFAFASGLAAEDNVLRLLRTGRPDPPRQRRLRRHVPPHLQGVRRGRLRVDRRRPHRPRRACATAGCPTRGWCGWRRRPTRCSPASTSRRSRRSPTSRARWSSSTTPSPRRTSSSRWRWAPTSSCTRRRSTSAATRTSSGASPPSTTTSSPSGSASRRTRPARCRLRSTATSCCAA